MSKLSHNVALLSMGCCIVEETKTSIECSAIKIISDSGDEIQRSWRSPISPAPCCIIDFSKVKQRPIFFNTIAFYHSACRAACASLIQAFYRQKKCEKWVTLGVFSLQRVAGWHRFSFKPVPQHQMNFLYIRLSQNFDGKDVSLTQLALGFEIQPQVQQLKIEMQELRVQNQLMKEKLDLQEREYTKMKDFMLQMQKQIKFMLSQTESDVSDDFVRLNKPLEEKQTLQKDEQTQDFDLLQ